MKKIVLKTLISTFIISAILGILIIFLDFWNDITGKILLSTVIIFGFSIPGLCCSTTYEKESNKTFSLFGIWVCFLSCIYFLLLIWGLLNFSFIDAINWEIMSSGVILSSSCGHISLLLIINSNNKVVKYFRNGTIFLSMIMDLMLLSLIYFGVGISWKVLSATAILIVLGTIVSPLMNKLTDKNNSKPDKYKKLEQLKKLLDNNVISEEEFANEKSKILNS